VTTEFELKTIYPKESPFRQFIELSEQDFPGEVSMMELVLDHRSMATRFFTESELDSLDATVTELTNLGDWIKFPPLGRDVGDWTFAFRRWLDQGDLDMQNQPFHVQLSSFLDAAEFPTSSGQPCPLFCVQPWTFRRQFVFSSDGLPQRTRDVMQTRWTFNRCIINDQGQEM
jgi:hypothetical protein